MNAAKRNRATATKAGTGVHPGERSTAKPGAVLKSLRKRNGWTLTEVSQRTGLPVSTLSKLENGKMALTFDKLLRLSEGLQVDFSRLFGPAAAAASGYGRQDFSGRRSITRAGEGKVIEVPHGSYLYLSSELLNKRMIPIIGEVRARTLAEFGEFHSHPGEEHLYVLDGELDLHTETYAPVRLKRGDSIYFDSGMGHAYLAVGDAPCRVISLCATSETRLINVLEGKTEDSEA
jgi:transcriptional regulator with XRE-family HTH domain